MTALRAREGKPGQRSLWGDEFEHATAAFLETPLWICKAVADVRPWWFAHKIAVEPCAGKGAIVHHADSLDLGITWHSVIEMRDEVEALHNLASAVSTGRPIQELDGVYSGSLSPDLGWTNLPWYKSVIPVCEAFWSLFPRAHLLGLCCTRFTLDGQGAQSRAAWLKRHRPEEILRLPERVSFRGAAYPHPVEWWYFLPGGERGAGRWDILERT